MRLSINKYIFASLKKFEVFIYIIHPKIQYNHSNEYMNPLL